jgi:hypothetical protein
LSVLQLLITPLVVAKQTIQLAKSMKIPGELSVVVKQTIQLAKSMKIPGE